jgi:hypothetical protein
MTMTMTTLREFRYGHVFTFREFRELCGLAALPTPRNHGGGRRGPRGAPDRLNKFATIVARMGLRSEGGSANLDISGCAARNPYTKTYTHTEIRMTKV